MLYTCPQKKFLSIGRVDLTPRSKVKGVGGCTKAPVVHEVSVHVCMFACLHMCVCVCVCVNMCNFKRKTSDTVDGIT